MPVSTDLLKQANAAVRDNAQLYKLLQNWEQAGGHSAGPMAANAAPQRPLPPDLAAALAAHLGLPKQMQPDELDAAETMLAMEGGGLGAAKKRTKASKVYEAAEPLEGEQPKKVYESHKQCAPNEFGMNKAGGTVKQALIGTTIGAVAGAAGAKPGKRVRESARGAAKGLGTDLGALVGGASGGTLGFLGGGAATLPLLGVGAIPGGIIGALGGGYAGGRMGYNIADKAIGPYQTKAQEEMEKLEQLLATYKKLKELDQPQKQAFMVPPDLAQGALREDLMKQIVPIVAANLGAKGLGALGALGGAAYGAYNPGAAASLDAEGRPTLKRRSRLLGALRGAAGYGLGGVAAGGALGNLAGRAYVANAARRAEPTVVPLNK